MEAHKVIFASASTTFKTLLGRNKHSHPLIYMRGMKSSNLLAILDFLYCGEANMLQDDLDTLLAFAEELQLTGLMGNSEERFGDSNKDKNCAPQQSLSTIHDETVSQMSPKLEN